MRKTVDQLRRQEHRTTSELFREALRVYASMRTSYTPTAAELRAIERGRASQPMTLEEARIYVKRLAGVGATLSSRFARHTFRCLGLTWLTTDGRYR